MKMKMKLKLVPLSSGWLAGAVACDYGHSKKRHSMNMIVYSSSKSSSSSSSKKNDSSSNSQPIPTPTPPRITSNAKQNLRFLKIWKVLGTY